MTPEENAANAHALEHAKVLSVLAEIMMNEVKASIEQDTGMTEALYREVSRILKAMADNMESFRKSMGH